MTVKDLLDVIDKSRDHEQQMVEVCTEYGEWEDYESLHTCSCLIDSIADKKIKYMAAISEDVFRIYIEW